MTKFGWTVFILTLLAIGALVAGYLIMTERAARGPAPTATSTPNLTDKNIFSDGPNGFTLTYPRTDTLDYTFKTFYHLPANWRVDADTTGTGTPIVAVVHYRSESDHAYPRYFDAEVRIGVSSNSKELARCEVAATDHGETALPDTTIGGVAWKTFSFESAGMMQYVKGISYRTIHEGKCIAIEKLAAGSNYRDDPVGPDTIPQDTLDAAYAGLDPIVASFVFARP